MGREGSRGSVARQIAPIDPRMRRSGDESKALFEIRFTTPPIESPSMSGVGDFVTSMRSIESEPTVWNWNSRVAPAEPL